METRSSKPRLRVLAAGGGAFEGGGLQYSSPERRPLRSCRWAMRGKDGAEQESCEMRLGELERGQGGQRETGNDSHVSGLGNKLVSGERKTQEEGRPVGVREEGGLDSGMQNHGPSVRMALLVTGNVHGFQWLSSQNRTVILVQKCEGSEFCPPCKLASYRLAEEKRLLGQRQRTLPCITHSDIFFLVLLPAIPVLLGCCGAAPSRHLDLQRVVTGGVP